MIIETALELFVPVGGLIIFLAIGIPVGVCLLKWAGWIG